jgi:hypothetical protein
MEELRVEPSGFLMVKENIPSDYHPIPNTLSEHPESEQNPIF